MHSVISAKFQPENQLQSSDVQQQLTRDQNKSNENNSNQHSKFFRFDSVKPKVDYISHPTVYPDYRPLPTRPYTEHLPMSSTLGDLMERWDQDDIDHPPTPFVEVLQHFEYSDPVQMEAARAFRDAEIPFKIVNVPDIEAAAQRWDVKYVGDMFAGKGDIRGSESGYAQKSKDNFFLFFNKSAWRTNVFGPYPTGRVRWSFAEWANHARRADMEGLEPDAVHYYFQAGTAPTEKFDKKKQGFISRDLPLFSSPDSNFFSFSPEESKGIQCRFGERGVTAATHYDAGRNMVAMIHGAKRYILSPPNACKYLGLETERKHPAFRHSMLNFGKINLARSSTTMSKTERDALLLAAQSPAIETILKRGEILYIPSYWFHYITSLQMSAQCNTRSGRGSNKGTTEFGNFDDVKVCR
eukprot:CAMPEP_0113298482 /NCGR_PEP_ID=MMETSP0010_2-20120614/908_1 /TAXON_ID=216773 ORGANISM="Corethron hystrix, Strain 308" /NCGR_SAMPLE_ID=MMETSP0010_2 /ASSEMBLY_ACC=CAM_ASM_000155 /LENGTH=410 /DNA_ID=CAMNT_0000151543 /DNA_START=308 /DNA_END=1540 /DNA_ORIENTATION=+ /assembly_acc=CAM_ASM_000155